MTSMSRTTGAFGGAVLAVIFAGGIHLPFSSISTPLLALFLALTACVYLGALLAQKQTLGVALLELVVAVLVFLCALLGTIASPVWLAIGYAIHGLWDWVHDVRLIPTNVASWFPPACAVFDFMIAIFVFVYVP